MPIEYSPRDTALLIISRTEILRPLEVVRPLAGPLSPFTRALNYNVATAALSFNTIDANSGFAIYPATIEPDPARPTVHRALTHDDPGPPYSPLPSLAPFSVNTGSYSAMSDDRRFDSQEVDFEPPTSDDETDDHGMTESSTGPTPSASVRDNLPPGPRPSDAFPDNLPPGPRLSDAFPDHLPPGPRRSDALPGSSAVAG